MKKNTIIILSFLGLCALIGLWFISAGNSIVRKDESVKTAWSQVETAYQRRMDLIPNLVNTVKGYASHEKTTLEDVIQARSAAFAGSGAQNLSQADLKKVQTSQEQLSTALGRLLVLVEKYPDLKANENFRDLQVQLEGTENRIAVERRRFNEAVQDFNTYIRIFPQSIVANMKGVTQKPYFEATQGAAVAPKVQF